MKKLSSACCALLVVLILVLSCSVSSTSQTKNILIKTSNDGIIRSGFGSYSFGKIKSHTSTSETFTIEYTGASNLELTGTPLVDITGSGTSVFSVTAQPTSPIASNSNTTFTIEFKPIMARDYVATVTIANSDANQNPYTFKLRGTGFKTGFDFNGDGFDDCLVAATDDSTGGTRAGSVSIFFGKSNWTTPINSTSADVYIIGENEYDELGYSLSIAGDVNSDGYDDIIVGAKDADDGGDKSGCAYIFYGNANPSANINAANADVKLVGEEAGDNFGCCVSNVGDFNGDGFDDVIVGSIQFLNNKSGCAYIFFGASNIASLIDASNADVKFNGETIRDSFGASCSKAGDINKDGFDDVIIGAAEDDDGGADAGCAFVFFGSSNPLSSVNANTADIKLVGESADDIFGVSVNTAGDLNNDGYTDIMVGAPHCNLGGYYAGRAYIFFGSSNWQQQINASSADVIITGGDMGEFLGRCLSNAGDVNNDGIDDILVSAIGDDEGGYNAGGCYIYYGKSAWSQNIGVADANVKLIGEDINDDFCISSSFAGDLNDDGFSDVIVGAYSNCNGGNHSGCAYVFLGGSNMSSSIDASLADIIIIGKISDHLGISVSGGK